MLLNQSKWIKFQGDDSMWLLLPLKYVPVLSTPTPSAQVLDSFISHLGCCHLLLNPGQVNLLIFTHACWLPPPHFLSIELPSSMKTFSSTISFPLPVGIVVILQNQIMCCFPHNVHGSGNQRVNMELAPLSITPSDPRMNLLSISEALGLLV